MSCSLRCLKSPRMSSRRTRPPSSRRIPAELAISALLSIVAFLFIACSLLVCANEAGDIGGSVVDSASTGSDDDRRAWGGTTNSVTATSNGTWRGKSESDDKRELLMNMLESRKRLSDNDRKEQHDAGLFRKVQTRLKQMFKEQLGKGEEHHKSRDVHSAKKRQNEDVRRSNGAFHQQDEISRRRVLYEASVNTHYLRDNNAEGVAARGPHLKDQSSKLPSKALNVRGTLSALIAGGGGQYIRETGGNNGEHRAGNAKCSHYAPPMNKAEVQAGRKVPHWAYSLCPERSLSKIRLEEKVNADSKFNSLGRSVQRIGEHWSEIVQTDTSLSLSLGKYVPPTQDSDSSLLSNAYRSHLVLWQDTEAPGPRFGAKRGTGVAAASGEGAEILNGIISYYGGGDECGDGLQLTSRVLTLEGCCPEEKIPPQGENHSIDGGTDSTVRILAVEEAIACFYNFLVCNECRDGDIAAVDSSPNVGPDKPSIVGGSPGFDPARNTLRPRDEAAHTYIRRLPNESLLRSHQSSVPASFPPMPMSKKQSNLKLLRQMFQRSYDSYMYNAYPAGELKPISCGPGTFDLVRLPALTLIDSLGSLVVMGNFTEFARSVERLRELDVMMQEEFSKLFAGPEDSMSLLNRKGGLFGVNQNVSVFETNIRALGGLLSAHQLAVAFLGNGVVKKENVWDGSGNILIGDYENFDGQTMDMKDNESVLDETGFNRCPSKCDLTLGSESSTALPCLSLFEEIGVKPDRLAACQSLMKKKVNTTSSGSKQVDNAYLPWVYDGLLLSLATDLGTRLLPAFSTDTGIPYGTVNLLYGVPPGETSVASLAGGGTLSIEMELLSRLTGDPSFGSAARLASRALWMRQSKTFGLLGKHIDVHSGDWVESLSGIGSNSDSFYEYLIKHHVLFPDDPDNDLWSMFVSAYDAVCTQNRMGHWYADVEMNGGRERGSRLVFESLMAFWPGLQVLAGELPSACQSADAFSIVREQLGMLPERFDVRSWRVDGKGGLSPLRPELLESIYFLHMATAGIGISVARGDSSLDSSTGWQWAADFALHALHDLTKTQCGHATVSAVHPNTTGSIAPENLFKDRSDQIVKEDNMPSYFLSETLKYLYLTFDDDDNILHGDKEREWIFTTEAHPVHHVPVVSDNVLDTPLLAINNDYLERIIMTLEEELSVGSNVTHQNAKIYSLDAKHEKNITSDQSKWTFQTKQEAFNAFIRNTNVTFHNKKDPKSESGSRVLRLERLKSQWPALKDFESEIYDEDVDVRNLATISLNRYGKGCGSALSQACPNFHQPNLKWVLALNSNLLDYGESFPAIKSEEERVATHGNRQATALSAAATYGSISIPADLLDSAGMCAIVDHQSGPRKNEASIIKPDSHEKELAERKLKISRLNMGDPLGDFDVAILGSGGLGFNVRHVNSGVVVEVSIVEDGNGNAETAVVITDTPASTSPNLSFNATMEDETFSIRRGIRSQWNGRVVSLQQSHPVNAVVEELNFDNDINHGKNSNTSPPPLFQRRRVTLAQTSGATFSCNVQLSSAEGEHNIAASLPCTPAFFGKTKIEKLVESGGLKVQGEIITSTSFGCSSQPSGESTKESIDRDGETIGLVLRGHCNFQTKAANLGRSSGRSAMIVINSDPSLFIMSGACAKNDFDCKTEDDEFEIPSVLVGKTDGQRIRDLVAAADKHGLSLLASVNISPSPENQLPIVKISPNQVKVLAPRGWGILAKRKDNEKESGLTQSEWELFIVQHAT